MMKNKTFIVSLVIVGLLLLCFSSFAHAKEPVTSLTSRDIVQKDYNPYPMETTDSGFVFYMDLEIDKKGMSFSKSDFDGYVGEYKTNYFSYDYDKKIMSETPEKITFRYEIRTPFFIGSFDFIPTVKGFADTSKSWYSSNFEYRKEVKINNQVDGTISNIIIPLEFTDTDLRDNAQNDGDDIFFTTFDNTQKVNHLTRKYIGSTGYFYGILNCSNLVDDTRYWMYYGNSVCGNQSKSGRDVFDASVFIAYYDMNDLTDISGNGYDGNAVGSLPTVQSGIVGSSQYFDEVGDWIEVNSLTSRLNAEDDGSIEIWAKSSDASDHNALFSINDWSDGSDYFIIFDVDRSGASGSADSFSIDIGDGGAWSPYSSSDICTNSWEYAVASSDGSNDLLYFDGNVESWNYDEGSNSGLWFNDLQSSGTRVSIGVCDRTGGAIFHYNGNLDEIGLYYDDMPSRYWKTRYNSMINCSNNGFFTIGKQLPNSPPSFTNQSPVNNSVNQDRNLCWSLNITDDYSPFNYSIECSNGQTTSNNNQNNGTFKLNITGLAYSIKYTIWVNATEHESHGLSSREIYYFTVKPAPGPAVSNKEPMYSSLTIVNHSAVYCCDIFNVSCYINDSNGDSIFWNFTINNFNTNGRNLNSTIWLNFSNWHTFVFPNQNYTIFLNLSDTKTVKTYKVFFSTNSTFCAGIGDNMDILVNFDNTLVFTILLTVVWLVFTVLHFRYKDEIIIGWVQFLVSMPLMFLFGSLGSSFIMGYALAVIIPLLSIIVMVEAYLNK